MSLLHHLPTEQVLFHAKSQQMELPPKYCSVGNVDLTVYAKKFSIDISETALTDQAEYLCCGMSPVYIVMQVHPFKIKSLETSRKRYELLKNGENFRCLNKEYDLE